MSDKHALFENQLCANYSCCYLLLAATTCYSVFLWSSLIMDARLQEFLMEHKIEEDVIQKLEDENCKPVLSLSVWVFVSKYNIDIDWKWVHLIHRINEHSNESNPPNLKKVLRTVCHLTLEKYLSSSWVSKLIYFILQIDETVIPSITDSNLAKYIPKVRDTFCCGLLQTSSTITKSVIQERIHPFMATSKTVRRWGHASKKGRWTSKDVYPNAEFEQGEGTGVLQDCLTEFWIDFCDSCMLGEEVKIPLISHDFHCEELQAAARVFVVGWKQLVTSLWNLHYHFWKRCYMAQQPVV